MLRSLLISSILLVSGTVYAQADYETLTSAELANFTNTNVVRANKKREVVGSPFLNDAWSKGYIVLQGERKTQDLLIRINLELNHLEVDYSNDNVLQVPSDKIVGLAMYRANGEVAWFSPGYQNDKAKLSKNELVHVVHNGDIKFIKRYKVRFFSDPGHQYGSGRKIDRYVHTTEHFIQLPGQNELERFKPSKRSVLALTKDKRKEVEAYAKKNKLSFNEDEDVARILRHYETIK